MDKIIVPAAHHLPNYLPAQPDTMGENNNYIPFKGCGIKMEHLKNLGFFRITKLI